MYQSRNGIEIPQVCVAPLRDFLVLFWRLSYFPQIVKPMKNLITYLESINVLPMIPAEAWTFSISVSVIVFVLAYKAVKRRARNRSLAMDRRIAGFWHETPERLARFSFEDRKRHELDNRSF